MMDKYAKKAHDITQKYIESYGAQFANIDALDDSIATAMREAAEHDLFLPFCYTSSTKLFYAVPMGTVTVWA